MLFRRINLRCISHAVIGFAALFACGIAAADPPARVARLANIDGAVSFSPAGEEEWAYATPNRPLITGDRVWADAGARAELQIGSLAVRLGSQTSVTILNLDDRVAQFQLAQGALNVRVRRLDPDQTIEVDTPLLAFSLRRPGDYRIDVDPASAATTIAVRSGEGEAYGEGAAYTIGARQWYRFADSGLRDYQYDALPPADAFDTWTRDRDRREDRPVAARYVSPEVIGYADLDDYGTWSVVEGYGNVWVPTSVARDWAPYHQGHWAWIEPWGWTWVDDAPWGFAPFHYGRWAYARERWCWVPGPVRVRPVYAPALVAFVGGNNFSISVRSGEPARGIAWFPLAPGEVYQPAYRVSRNYFTNINISNTNVSNTYITNVYNKPDAANIVYRNREQRGGMTAVPVAAFVQSRPVAQSAMVVSRDVSAAAPVTAVAAIAPVRASVMGGAAGAAVGGAPAAGAGPGMVRRPPPATIQRPVMARVAPPPPPAPFNARESVLAKDPGRPADPATAVAVRPAATAAPAAPAVKVVAPVAPGAPPPAPTMSRPRTNAPPTAPGSAPAAAGGAPATAPAAGVAPGIAPRQGTALPVPQPTGAPPPVPTKPPSGFDKGGPGPKADILPAPAPPATVPVPPPTRQAAPSVQPPSQPPKAVEVRPVPQPPPAVAQPPVAPTPAPAELRRELPPPPRVNKPPTVPPPAELRREPPPPPIVNKPPTAPSPPPAELRREPPPGAAPAAAKPAPAPPPAELRREPPPPAAVKPPAPPPVELRREPAAPPVVAKPPVVPTPPAAVPAAPATVRQAEPKAKGEPAKGEAPKAKSEEKRDDQK